jgi:hypothetical protein
MIIQGLICAVSPVIKILSAVKQKQNNSNAASEPKDNTKEHRNTRHNDISQLCQKRKSKQKRNATNNLSKTQAKAIPSS